MDYRVFYPILDVYGARVLVVLFGLLLLLQYKRPLRRWVKGVRGRFLANAGVAAPTFAVLRLVLIPAEVAFEASVAFHHSNWRLPFRLERPLNWIVVTPRIHGIHHSIVQRETNSNYSNLFTIWDRLHRTIRLNVRQDVVVVGVPGYQEDDYDHTLVGLLTLPFRRQKEYWKLPDGTQPDCPDEGHQDRLVP